MIRLNNVNKYFNRHKKNQIHVINNSSIEFPESGLVALLGPSGSGKTTMLNTIGGLDKISSGSIYVNGEKITRSSSRKIDKIRNLNIGYIFQDYKLVESMTVYENVALSLKITGIKDKEEIKKRVMYALEQVKMDRYKNRLVTMLSGGEKQRVGIARALVKNPKIILADEPTGNLDSKNSISIMNIIKSISKKVLVILVTHEEELARFYADRVVELEDGKILKDYKNKANKTLKYDIENRIYLKDYENIDKIKKDNINISIYRDSKEKVNLKIVFKNGNIYIDSDTDEKLEVIDKDSNIELINEKYREFEKEDIDSSFDLESISNNEYKHKYSSIFKFASFIPYGLKKVLDYPPLKKILLFGFLLSGMFIYYGVSSISATLNIKDEDFIAANKNYLVVNKINTKIDDYLSYEKLDNINYILPSDSIVNFRISLDKYYQTQYVKTVGKGSISSINDIKSSDLIMGVMPKGEYEVVVDKLVLKRLIKEKLTSSAGFFNESDYLNKELEFDNMDKFKIVGITDKLEPNIYVNNSMFQNIISSSVSENEFDINRPDKIVDYNLAIDKNIKLSKGNLPVNDYEVIVNKNYEYEYPIGKKIDLKVNKQKLKVVGYYEVVGYLENNPYYVSENTIKINNIANANRLVIYSKDSDSTIKYFRDNKMNIYSSYDYSKDNYMKSIEEKMTSTIITSAIILGISLVEMFLMMRSSFLSRIKEVGIYRAIGVKKTDIYKMFSGEVFAISIIASIPGVIFMYYILNSFRNVSYIGPMFMNNIFTFTISALIVVIFNFIIGLLPVWNTIRKTPAEILARIDVD